MRFRALLFVALTVPAGVVLQTQSPPNSAAPPQAGYLRCGALWDGKGDQLQRDVIIGIEGGRIRSVGGTAPAAGRGLIDLAGETCLPGLIDAHTHVFALSSSEIQQGAEKDSVAARTIRALTRARKALEYGFTSIRDLNDMGMSAADVDIRRGIARGLIVGPRMQVSTTGLSVSGAATSRVRPCDGADGCRRAVREAIALGADWVKVFGDRGVRRREGIFDDQPTLTLDEMRAVVDEAHRQGRRVAAHASGKTSVNLAIAAGVDSIEHGMFIAAEDIDVMAARGIWYVPSLYLMTKAVFTSPEQAAQSKPGIDIINETFRRARRAGVRIAFGSDVGAFDWNVTPAVQLPMMVQLGMTPVQALKSATADAADLLQTQRDVGTIEIGKFADIIAVRGNPLDAVTLLQQVSFVMKGGVVYRQPPVRP